MTNEQVLIFLDKINEIENKLDELAVESCTENTSLEDLIYEIQVQIGALKDFIKWKSIHLHQKYLEINMENPYTMITIINQNLLHHTPYQTLTQTI